jgi:hypothetical protein
MKGLLIANKDAQARQQLAARFDPNEYRITSADSVANALEGIINKEIQVVVLDGHYDEQNVARLVPLLKKCNRNLAIVLSSTEMPLDLLKRIRQEGIFYHALRNDGEDNSEEIYQAVSYAFKTYQENQLKKEKAMYPIKSILSALVITMMLITPAFAVDTATTYSSGVLVLLFIGFCALLIVAQLVPAVLVLFGMTKAVTRGVKEKQTAAVNAK